jgi:hypothetical protein
MMEILRVDLTSLPKAVELSVVEARVVQGTVCLEPATTCVFVFAGLLVTHARGHSEDRADSVVLQTLGQNTNMNNSLRLQVVCDALGGNV